MSLLFYKANLSKLVTLPVTLPVTCTCKRHSPSLHLSLSGTLKQLTGTILQHVVNCDHVLVYIANGCLASIIGRQYLIVSAIDRRLRCTGSLSG